MTGGSSYSDINTPVNACFSDFIDLFSSSTNSLNLRQVKLFFYDYLFSNNFNVLDGS